MAEDIKNNIEDTENKTGGNASGTNTKSNEGVRYGGRC